MRLKSARLFAIAALLCVFIPTLVRGADINFDFGLPIFGFEEIRFEKTKTVDFNIQLLKKYLNEHHSYPLTQFHCITRWFDLLKLSDTPRREQLIKESSRLFSLEGIKNPGVEERLRAIYFFGLLLAQDRDEDPQNVKDHAFEEMLLEAEDYLSKNGHYHMIKGIIFHFLRNRPNAFFSPMKPEEDLKRALTLMPSTSHHFYVMGQAFRLLGTADSTLFLSIASYEKSTALEPRNGKLQNALLSIYMGLHEDFQSRGQPEPFWLEEAVYKKILSVSPNNPHALNNLGYLYAEYGVNTAMAQELCQRAVDMQPNNAGFRDSLGWAAFKNRDYEKSEEELLKSIKLRDNVYEPYYHIGTLYYATGKLNKAADYYQKAIGIKPDSAEALNNLAYLYTEQNRNIKEALSMAETAVRIEPNNASYIDTLGWAHYRLGNLDKALALLKKADQLSPGQGEILLHIGRVYLDMHDFDNAMVYLKEAYKADPKLSDPDNSVYLAIRLRHYLAALADYHSLKGAEASKDKIINILMAISRLYQEERMYDKAIEITQLCSEIKREERKLDKPLLGNYKIGTDRSSESAPTEKPALEQNENTEAQTENTDITPEEKPDTPDRQDAKTEATDLDEEQKRAEDGLFSGLPPETDHPLIIKFGPVFFDFIKTWLPGAEIFSDKSLTIFFRKINIKLYRNSVFRIESETSTGSGMLQLFAASMQQMGFEMLRELTHDEGVFRIGKRNMFLKAFDNSLYLSSKPLTGTSEPKNLANLCRYNPSAMAEIIYNWKALQKLMRPFLRMLIRNPCGPYERIYSRYFLRDGSLNEFSALSTGKAEDNAFMRRLARELFAFKIYMQKFGIDTTVKLRGDGDVIYVSTEFENLSQLINRSLGSFKDILINILEKRTASFRCFINRTFYIPSATSKMCPLQGKASIDVYSGVVECSRHENIPTIPVFLDEHHACKFSRQRLEKIIQAESLKIPEESEQADFIEKLMHKYEITPCTTDGNWIIDGKGNIKCSDHEN